MKVFEIVRRAARKPACWLVMFLALVVSAGALNRPGNPQNGVLGASPRPVLSPTMEAFEHRVSMYREGLLLDPDGLRNDFGLARLQVALRPVWAGTYTHSEFVAEIVDVLSPIYGSVQVHPTLQEYRPRHYQPCDWWLQCTSTTSITIGDDDAMPMCIDIETGMRLE
jgi:hypothetical protein